MGPGLRTTALLIDDEILIDAGTGVGDLSLSQQRRIKQVFLTHSHLDHVCGLAFMADNLFDLIDRPIEVHATPETLAIIREHLFNWKIWPDFAKLPDEEHPLLHFNQVETGTMMDIGGYRTLMAYPVLHTVPAVGYVVQSPQSTFAFSGDTYPTESLWQSLNGLSQLDKLMIEVAFTDEDAELARVSRHFTPRLLGEELKKLKHRPELFLTHHKPGCEQIIEKECRAALKGWEYHHLRRGDIIMS
ncbi:MAG TPA: 3',5'-cyclic-nucleotide phosphodiesterase [Nevskiaceae bacterium]|nr:3',5'-cyclic-nucleotide phosphodiesterase [Nevskiaceae bacterium]